MNQDILSRLQHAQSEAERERLVLEFSLSQMPAVLQTAVKAAAIPHWFDAEYLSALLDSEQKEAFEKIDGFSQLTQLSFIEPFPGRGFNMHERTGRMLRDKLWEDEQDLYRTLSQRAAQYSSKQDQDDISWKVETIYHVLLADTKEIGSIIFSNQCIQWYNNFEYEKVEVLLRPVLEAIKEDRLHGETVAWAYFFQGSLDTKYSRNQEAKSNLERASKHVGSDQAVEANVIKALGDVHGMLAEYSEARTRYEQALPIYQTIGARLGEANVIQALGDVHVRLDEYSEARTRYEQALPIYQTIGDRLGEANVIQALGDVHVRLAEYSEARTRYEQALPIYQTIGARLGEANVIQALGDVHVRLAEYSEARTRYEQALPIYQTIGARLGEANVIKALGDVHVRLDEYSEARTRYEQALPIYQTIGARLGEANVIKALGDVHVRLDEYSEARTRYEQALPIYQTIGDRLGEANVIKALGDVHGMLAEYSEARTRYEQALPIYQTIGARLGEANVIQALGDLQGEIEQIPEAVSLLQDAAARFKALGLVTQEASCWNSIGNLWNTQERLDEALAAYDKAIEIKPEAMWFRNRADTYIELKVFTSALEDLDRAEKLHPGQPHVHYHRGRIALWQQQVNQALLNLQEAVAMRPRNNGFQFWLAIAWLVNHHPEEAQQTLQIALDLTYKEKELADSLTELQEIAALYLFVPGFDLLEQAIKKALESFKKPQ